MPTRRLLITGQVQGVGFRDFARRAALRLGLEGEVWNRIDGAVEVLAAHAEEAALDEFEDTLGSGPGRVQGVQSEDVSSPGPLGAFRIGPTR